MMLEVESVQVSGAGPEAETRAWCFDCYDRREPWVLRCLGEHGVSFRHVVIEHTSVCHSCNAALPIGLHAIEVRVPVARLAPRARASGEECPL